MTQRLMPAFSKILYPYENHLQKILAITLWTSSKGEETI